METKWVVFYKDERGVYGRDSDNRCIFPSTREWQGRLPGAGQTWEVQIVGISTSGKSKFASPVRGPFLSQVTYTGFANAPMSVLNLLPGVREIEDWGSDRTNDHNSITLFVCTEIGYDEAVEIYRLAKEAQEVLLSTQRKIEADEEAEKARVFIEISLPIIGSEKIAEYITECTQEAGYECIPIYKAHIVQKGYDGWVEVDAVQKSNPVRCWAHKDYYIYLSEGKALTFWEMQKEKGEIK